MKKVIISLLAIIISGCTTGKIIVQKDEFKNATIVSLQLYYHTDERIRARTEFKFLKEIINNEIQPIVINLKIRASSGVSDLKPEIFIQVDKKKYQLLLTDRTCDIHATLSESNNYVKSNGSKIRLSNVKIFSSKLTLTKEIEESILAASKLRIRIYFGIEPATYTIDEGDLTKIKEFLRTQPLEEKL